MSYQNLLNKYGSEFDILLNLPYDAFENKEDFLLAEGIKRMREARVIIEEGYDGEYGKIKVFEQNEARDWFQKDLFCMGDNKLTSNKNKRVESGTDIKEFKHLKSAKDAGLFSDVESTVKEDGLNESQLKAVKYLHGSSLIIAGPGTGKTRTLTYKILELINSNINPENILALTFSNHAAKEIFERVKNMLHDKDIVDKKIISKLSVSTFHSFGLSIIDENIELTGRKKKYFIINTRDKEILFKNFLNIKQSEMKKYIQDISNIKQQLIKINDVQDEDLKKVYLKYNEVLIENNLFDFDDLLYLPLYIFIKHPDILKCYQNRYKWINIDEYQDINYAQYSLVRILAPEKSSNITVIGDPNQAIYGFRGADVKYIQEFKNDYPETLIFQLDTSYRCSSNILNASQQIINQSQDKLFYLKGMEQGLKIKIKEYSTDKTEAEFVARQIESMMGGLRFFSMDSGISDGQENADVLGLSDFAVLCRIGQQMRCIEKAFIDHSIPYQKIGETPFYNNQPFSSIIDLIKLIVNPHNTFLKISLNKLKISDEDIINLSQFLQKNKLQKSIQYINEKYFDEYLIEYKNEFERLNEISKEFDNDTEAFIRLLETGQNVDAYKKNMDSVRLMTMHSSKGLEFNSVFVVGCCDKILPFSLYENYKVNIQEEKRLLYVSMTRAKKYLFLTYPNKINISGRIIKTTKSPFIDGIKNELIDFHKQEVIKKKKKTDDDQLSLF